jgi:hypothetical protein
MEICLIVSINFHIAFARGNDVVAKGDQTAPRYALYGIM